MQQRNDAVQAEPLQRNTINRYLTSISNSLYAGGAACSLTGATLQSEAWIFRDDIGAPHTLRRVRSLSLARAPFSFFI